MSQNHTSGNHVQDELQNERSTILSAYLPIQCCKRQNYEVQEKNKSETIQEKDEKMQRKIKFHFLNPWQKIKERKIDSIKKLIHLKNLVKIILHGILIVFVTVQAVIFTNHSSKLSKFLIRNEDAFGYYFKQTKCNEDTDKLHTLDDVYNQITLITNSFYDVSKQAVGSFDYVIKDGVKSNIPPNLTMAIVYYEVGCGKDESILFPYTSTTLVWYTDLFPQNLDNAAVSNDESCCNTESSSSSRCSLEYCDCSVEDQINCYINESNLDRINKIFFNFKLSTFFRDHIIEDDASIHATFYIQITLMNDLYSSMAVSINLQSRLIRYCGHFKTEVTGLDIAIIIVVMLSFGAYGKSVHKSYRLAKELKLHFMAIHEKVLKKSHMIVLFNKWYIFMLFTNFLILIAIIIKMVAEYKEEISISQMEWARVLLGTGIFCLYCGIFGVLSYFESLNVLFITIQLAFPSFLRFAICVTIFFIAFAICGWLVLGPYHPKFEDFSLSMESLYCILNGDDLYTTFELAHLNTQSYLIKLFSEIYLVLFVFVFIYAVLSLFIGIFNHTYESLSQNWKQHSYGVLRDWAEGKLSDDQTDHDSYPFPRLPTLNYDFNTPVVSNSHVNGVSPDTVDQGNRGSASVKDQGELTSALVQPQELSNIGQSTTPFVSVIQLRCKDLRNATEEQVSDAKHRLGITSDVDTSGKNS